MNGLYVLVFVAALAAVFYGACWLDRYEDTLDQRDDVEAVLFDQERDAA